MRPWMVAGLLMAGTAAHACDVCGIYLGIQPHDRVSQFGLLHRYRFLEGDVGGGSLLKHGDHGGTTGTRQVREQLAALELRGEFWLTERWSVIASLPLVNNYQQVDGKATADVYGVGDPFVLGRWMAVNTKCLADEIRWVHRLMIGGGVKMPVGRSDVTHAGVVLDHDVQPGTGTWDGLGSVQYLVRHDQWGAGLSSIARFNSANSEGYRYGHGFNLTAEFFRNMDLEHVKLMPSLGGYMEYLAQDAFHEQQVPGTGGNTLFAQVGMRGWWKAWSLGIQGQYAVARDIGELMVPDRWRTIIGLSYNLIKT